MKNTTLNENGVIVISDEAIGTLVKIAAQEIEGVTGLQHNIADQLTSFFGKSKLQSAIRMENDESGIVFDVNLRAKYGYNVAEIASKVQNNIKQAIESMLDITVQAVNVHIVGLDSEK
ncbi:Asp23/Gls24 family envelope stress response protein [Guggenheimella bovis]